MIKSVLQKPDYKNEPKKPYYITNLNHVSEVRTSKWSEGHYWMIIAENLTSWTKTMSSLKGPLIANNMSSPAVFKSLLLEHILHLQIRQASGNK